MLDPHAAEHRAPVILERPHQEAGIDLLSYIIDVAGVGGEREVRLCRVGCRAHFRRIEVAEGIVHRNFSEERLIERELVVVGRDADGGELGGSIQEYLLFVDHLGALVHLEAQLERRLAAHELRFALQH